MPKSFFTSTSILARLRNSLWVGYLDHLSTSYTAKAQMCGNTCTYYSDYVMMGSSSLVLVCSMPYLSR
jgi:hypothetical protein